MKYASSRHRSRGSSSSSSSSPSGKASLAARPRLRASYAPCPYRARRRRRRCPARRDRRREAADPLWRGKKTSRRRGTRRRGERRQILRRETHAQVHSERATHRADEFARGFVRADGGELEGTLGADRPPRRRSPPRVRIAIVDFGHVHGKPGRRPARHGPLHVGLKQRRERASRPEHPAIEAHGLEVRLDARPARLRFVLERRPRHAIVRLVTSRKRATARPERFHGVFPLRVPRLFAAHERRGDYVRVVHVRRHNRERARVARRIVANFEQRLYPRRVRLVKRLQVPRSARARRGEAFEDRLGGRAEFPRRLGAHTRVAPLLRRVLRGGVEGFETRRKRRASRTVHSRCRVQA